MTLRIVRAGDAALLDPKPLGPLRVEVDSDDLAAICAQERQRGRALAVADAAALLREARAEREAAFELAERDLVTLALSLAGRIVGRELTVAPDTLADMVAHALTAVHGRHELTLRTHPQDLAVLGARRAQLEAAAGGAVRLLADPRRARYSVCVDTEAGTLECDLETQIEVLAERMGVAPPE